MNNVSKLMIFFLVMESICVQAMRTDFMNNYNQSKDQLPIKLPKPEIKLKSILKEKSSLDVADSKKRKIQFDVSEEQELALKRKRRIERVERYKTYKMFLSWNVDNPVECYEVVTDEKGDFKRVPKEMEINEIIISEQWQMLGERNLACREAAIEDGDGDIKKGLEIDKQRVNVRKDNRGLILKGLKYDALLKQCDELDKKYQEQSAVLNTAITFVAIVVAAALVAFNIKGII
jgi:hypothetical protein